MLTSPPSAELVGGLAAIYVMAAYLSPKDERLFLLPMTLILLYGENGLFPALFLTILIGTLMHFLKLGRTVS